MTKSIHNDHSVKVYLGLWSAATMIDATALDERLVEMTDGSASSLLSGSNLPESTKSSNIDIMPQSLSPGGVSGGEPDWDAFDPHAYYIHNYRVMRDDDRQIVEKIRDFFAKEFAAADRLPNTFGVDVGAGANLYPCLGMLPFCSQIELLDYSAANVKWLERKKQWLWTRVDRRWDAFWRVYSANTEYSTYLTNRRFLRALSKIKLYWILRRKVRVRQASVFGLPEKAYDVGTMFFVACSLSTDPEMFQRAVTSFGRALKPGAPFAAAFMTNSYGYLVGNKRFPAVPVGPEDIELAIKHLGPDVNIDKINSVDPLRPGVGMVLVRGKRAL